MILAGSSFLILPQPFQKSVRFAPSTWVDEFYIEREASARFRCDLIHFVSEVPLTIMKRGVISGVVVCVPR